MREIHLWKIPKSISHLCMASFPTSVEALPSKDAALFKSTLRFYEHKQYKKGLKVCEQLLKRHPNHGGNGEGYGSWCNLNRREEGYENVRQGLKLSLKSHVCWHVYGLLYRADKNYDEAMKCYRNALRLDKDNGQILRDLAVLQLQMRQYASLCETRYHLLTLRPVVKLNWISLAIAYHLCGKYEQAIGILDAVLDGFPLESNTRTCSLEQGEIILYKSFILNEWGKPEDAYNCLRQESLATFDTLQLLEKRAELLMPLGRLEESSLMWKQLLTYNSESRKALQGYLQSLNRKDSHVSTHQVLVDLCREHPESLLIKLATIHAAREDHLKNNLIDMILPMIRKGVLSAFSVIRRLYEKEENFPVLDEFSEAVLKEISVSGDKDVAWLHVLMAQHYSLRPGQGDKAINHLENAATLKPKVPEIFLYYSKILKRLGHTQKAADCMNYGRRLDLSDRYLNSKAVKYFLRADRVQEAKELAVLFVKKGDFDHQLKDLVEMQVLWYAHEVGLSFQRQGNHLLALSYFDQIRKHFDDFYDDQFDFHNYVLRRMTLCSYVKYTNPISINLLFRMLRYEDVISGHIQFFKSASAAISSLISLHDCKNEVQERFASLKISGETDLKESKIDDYLGEALKWVNRIILYRGNDPASYELAFEVYYRQGMFLKAIQSLHRAASLGKMVKVTIPLELLFKDISECTPEFEASRQILQDISSKIKVKATTTATTPSHHRDILRLDVPILDGLLSI